MQILCERDEAVARLLCAKIEEFNADLPLGESHGVHVLERARMQLDGVPDDGRSPGRTQAALRGGEGCVNPGPGEAKLFLEVMIQIGEDGYAGRNHRLTKIMQLPPRDRRNAAYAILPSDTPFVRRLEGLGSCRPGTLSMASQVAYGPPFKGRCCTRC